MIKTLLVASRDRARLEEILGIVTRFSLGVLLARLVVERDADIAQEVDDPQTLPPPSLSRTVISRSIPRTWSSRVGLIMLLADPQRSLEEFWLS